MLRTYRALLRGGHIEWTDPPPAITQEATPVYITILDVKGEQGQANGAAMAEALERLSHRGGIASIVSPDEWQREMRQDRNLPTRDA